jgi:hypothetical protein
MRHAVRALGGDLRGSALDLARDAGVAFEPSGASGASGEPVHHDQVAALPEPVRRYLDFMQVVGQPRVDRFVVRFQGRFRMKAGAPWMPCDAWQVNASSPVARLFCMKLTFARVIPMVGRDTYVDGKGAMHGKVLGLVPVADGEGPDFDEGELVTWLNDALLLAPSMLLDPAVTWEPVDDASFRVAVTDLGRTVTAQVFVDERGAITDFTTTNRFLADGKTSRRAEWRTPVPEWITRKGRPFPGAGGAEWHLPEGPLRYIEGHFDPASFEVRPV